MGLLSSLENKYGFTDVECKLADYILEHTDEISSLNINELAERTYTSNPTIIRLCKKLGLAGYRDFRIEFATELEKNRFDKSNLDFNYPFHKQESTTSIMQNVATVSKEAINICYSSLSLKAMNKAARWLAGATHIYIYAIGDSLINTIAFSNMLMKLGFHSIIVNQYDENIALTYNATKDDVALFVSYGGSIVNMFEKEIRILKKHKCRTILITSDSNLHADVTIHFPNKEQTTKKAAGYYSQTAIRYVLNCLYGIIYSLDYETNKERKDKVEMIDRELLGN